MGYGNYCSFTYMIEIRRPPIGEGKEARGKGNKSEVESLEQGVKPSPISAFPSPHRDPPSLRFELALTEARHIDCLQYLSDSNL